MKYNKAYLSISICGLALLLKYIVQLFPALIGSDLMHSIGLTAFQFGLLASSYYYSYTFMQIFAGYVLDRFDLNIPATLAIGAMAVGLVLFPLANSFLEMCLLRILLGFGASFVTVLYMRCAASWCSLKTFGIISSFLATTTMLGAALGSAPLLFLFGWFSWTKSLMLIGIIAAVIAMFCLPLVKKNLDNEKQIVIGQNLGKQLKFILNKKDNWLLMLYSGFTFGPVAILGGIWGVPFMMEKYQFSTGHSSELISLMFIGHAIGSPVWLLISNKLNRDVLLMYIANGIAFLSITVIILGHISFMVNALFFFLFGFSVGCFMLSFKICRQITPLALIGLTIAFINTGEGIVGAVIEPLIGKGIDILYGNNSSAGIFGYEMMLLILPLCFLLSSICLHFFNKHGYKVTATNLHATRISV